MDRGSQDAHPGQQDLIAYRDGELPEARQREIAAHIEVCDECCSLLESLDNDLESFMRIALGPEEKAPVDARAELERLLARVAELQIDLPPQVRQQLEALLGRDAGTLPRDPDMLFETVRPLLTVLLGKTAAMAMENRIRRELLPGGPQPDPAA